jgi:hypothetical protein
MYTPGQVHILHMQHICKIRILEVMAAMLEDLVGCYCIQSVFSSNMATMSLSYELRLTATCQLTLKALMSHHCQTMNICQTAEYGSFRRDLGCARQKFRCAILC